MAIESAASDPCAELVAARRDLLALIETLDPQDWDKSTLCDSWRVRDVVAHVAQLPDLRGLKLLPRVLKARGSVAKARDEAARKEGQHDPAEIVEHLRSSLECGQLRLGTSVDRALVDTVIHSLDISYPHGWELHLPADRARRVLSILVELGDPLGGKARAESLHLDTTDIDWRCGRGDHVRGSAPVMLLALAGRPVCDQLTGEGVPVLARRG